MPVVLSSSPFYSSSSHPFFLIIEPSLSSPFLSTFFLIHSHSQTHWISTMLRAELCVRTFSGCDLRHCSEQSNLLPYSHSLFLPKSSPSPSSRLSISQFRNPIPPRYTSKPKPFISCQKQSHGMDHDFLEASLLLPETIRHYHLRKQELYGEAEQSSSSVSIPFSARGKDFRADITTIGLGILRHFQNPTIFLKISCDGDFLLPIVVGDFAVEKLIDSFNEEDHEDYSNHFLFVRNIVLNLGYEVKMVKITKRMVNTYFSRIYFGKMGEAASFSVDACPSDAINVANRCKAPIYVNKQIVLEDALKIAYGSGRICDRKPIYDVLLDSPIEGPDLLGEEFKLVQKMKLAVKEERYREAAMLRNKLVKLQNSGL